MKRFATPVQSPPFRWLSGRQVIGLRLYDRTGQWSGKVVDVSVDWTTMRVTHCVCEPSGPSARSNEFAVPWEEVAMASAVYSKRVEARLSTAMPPSASLPARASVPASALGRATGNGTPARAPGPAGAPVPAAAPAGASSRLRPMLGMTVVDSADRPLGRVEDIVVEHDSARVVHLLLSFGGFLGLGRQHALVPAGALRRHANAALLVLPLDRERLAGLTLRDTPRLANGRWLAAACGLLATTGFAAGRDGADAAADTGGNEGARIAHGFGALEEHVRGTIVAMESSSRQRKGIPRQRLRIRTAAGREFAVLLAVLDDRAQRDLAIRVGQQAFVRGWWAGRGPHSILVASGITVDGRTIAIDEVPRDEVWMPQ